MDTVPMTNFLKTALADQVLITRESDTVRLIGRPRSGALPNVYDGVCEGVEHLVSAGDGTVSVSSEPICFSVTFPADYLASTDATLLYRVVRVHSPLYHPNHLAGSGVICLGRAFRAGTRLRALVYQLYSILGCQNFASDSPLDTAASAYYVAHAEQIRALRARPLWRSRVSTVIARDSTSGSGGHA